MVVIKIGRIRRCRIRGPCKSRASDCRFDAEFALSRHVWPLRTSLWPRANQSPPRQTEIGKHPGETGARKAPGEYRETPRSRLRDSDAPPNRRNYTRRDHAAETQLAG